MEAISSILPHLIRGMWATFLDVTDAFLSVSLSLPIQKYICFVLNGKEGFYVSKASIWTDFSPLGFLQANETHQEKSKTPESSCLVLPGRLSDCGSSKSSLRPPYILDSRSVGVARFQYQRGDV